MLAGRQRDVRVWSRIPQARQYTCHKYEAIIGTINLDLAESGQG